MSSGPVYTGNLSNPSNVGVNSILIRGKDSQSWNPRTGFQITRPYWGEESEVNNVAFEAQSAGIPYSIMAPGPEGGMFRLDLIYSAEAAQPNNEPLTDTWEFDGNTLEKELWELPDVRSAMMSILYNLSGTKKSGGALIRAYGGQVWIKNNVEKYIKGDATFHQYLADDTISTTETALTFPALLEGVGRFIDTRRQVAIQDLIALYLRGVKVFPVSQFVLRRTRSVLWNYIGEVDYLDVFKALTRATLFAHNPTLNNLPNAFKLKIPGGTRLDDTYDPNGGVWVKQTPSIKPATASKWNILEEWWHADHAELEIYGPPI